MAITRKKLSAKPAAHRSRPLSMQTGKGKPPAKPAAKAPVKPAVKPAAKTVVKPIAHSKPSAKPVAKAPVKPAAKSAAPASKVMPRPAAKSAPPGAKSATPAAKGAKPPAAPKPPAVLNKGAAAAKAMAEQRAAERAAAEARRAPKLVPAGPGAFRPGAAKATPAKGKAAPKPAPEVRPLGVLPPESMAKSKPAPTHPRVVIPARPANAPPTGTRTATRGDDRLTDEDLKYFETRLLEERARVTREMGHFENTLLKVNPRDSSGDVGGYSFHMADAGTDSMEREISFDIASKEGRFMREIDDALRRIYNGVFGICEASGLPIPRARLEALPWARYTVHEQENIEKQQRAGRLAKEEE